MAKVLLVDDNHDALDLLELFLFKSFEVITALNGFEALKKAEEESPDIIITDIMMPSMDGVRFFNNLKRIDKTAAIPVLAVTSYMRKIAKKSLMNMGFEDVLPKPATQETVLGAINKILQSRQTNEIV